MRKLLAVLLLLAWIPLCGQPARGQSPGVGIKSPKINPDNSTSRTNPTGQRGTKDDPLVVDTLGHQETPIERKKAEEQAAEAKAEGQYHRDIDRWTLIWSETAAIATAVLVLVGIGGVLAALITLKALKREFEMSHRPWVAVGVTITAPIISDADWTHVTVTCALRNTGDSPAIRTSIDITIDASWEQDQIDSNWKKFCEKPGVPLANYFSVTLFPGDPYPWEMPFHISRKTIKANRDPVEDRFSHLTIMGRVGYEYSFAKGQHTTPFIYEIWEDGDSRIQLPRIGSGEIPKEAIKLVPRIALSKQTIECQAT